ncbi:MAG: sugar ABC transporter permease [Candidatus Planktophila sp.]|jgi:multiple sugar transport system permease protein
MKTTATIKKNRSRRSLSGTDRFTLSAFIGIPSFLQIILLWVPALVTIILSFTYWNGVRISDIKWAGFQNYKNIFLNNPIFYQALKNNGIWLAWFLLIATPLGVLLAYQIDRQIKGHKIYESIYYLPVVLSLAVIGIIWNFMFQPGGFVQGLMGRDIGNAVSIWGNPKINTWIIMAVASWRHIGYIMLLYLSGLKSVDPALREAAAIDGATEWQIFRKIILPTMKPVNIIILVITLIESLRAFDLVYIIYGSPTVFPLLNLLVFQNFAGQGISMKGAAYAVILLLLCIIPIITYLRVVFKEDLK